MAQKCGNVTFRAEYLSCVCRVGRWALVKKLLKIAFFIRATVRV